MYSWSPMLLRPYCSFCNALLRLSLVVLCVSHARSYVSAFLAWIHLYLYLNHSTTSLAHVFLFKFLGPCALDSACIHSVLHAKGPSFSSNVGMWFRLHNARNAILLLRILLVLSLLLVPTTIATTVTAATNFTTTLFVEISCRNWWLVVLFSMA